MPRSYKITARLDGIDSEGLPDDLARYIRGALERQGFRVGWLSVQPMNPPVEGRGDMHADRVAAQAANQAREAQIFGETDEFKRLSAEVQRRTTDMDRRAGVGRESESAPTVLGRESEPSRTVMGYTATGVMRTWPEPDDDEVELFSPSHKMHDNGVIEVFNSIAYVADKPGGVVTTCGTCYRRWDDSVSTAVTPVPSGRCPFEYEHAPQERKCGNELCDKTLTVADQFCSPACHREFQVNHGTR